MRALPNEMCFSSRCNATKPLLVRLQVVATLNEISPKLFHLKGGFLRQAFIIHALASYVCVLRSKPRHARVTSCFRSYCRNSKPIESQPPDGDIVPLAQLPMLAPSDAGKIIISSVWMLRNAPAAVCLDAGSDFWLSDFRRLEVRSRDRSPKGLCAADFIFVWIPTNAFFLQHVCWFLMLDTL